MGTIFGWTLFLAAVGAAFVVYLLALLVGSLLMKAIDRRK